MSPFWAKSVGGLSETARPLAALEGMHESRSAYESPHPSSERTESSLKAPVGRAKEDDTREMTTTPRPEMAKYQDEREASETSAIQSQH